MTKKGGTLQIKRFSEISKLLKKECDLFRKENRGITLSVEMFTERLLKLYGGPNSEISTNARMFSQRVLVEATKEKRNLSYCKELLAETLGYSSYQGLKVRALDEGIDPFIDVNFKSGLFSKGIVKDQYND